MTRGNLLIVVVLVLALAGMFFWTLNLEQRLAERPGASPESPDRGQVVEHRIEELENSVLSLREENRSQTIEIEGLKSGFTKLQDSDAAQARLLSNLSGQELAAAPAAAPVDEGLKRAVEEVLKEKEERDRAARYERMARGWSRFLLSEINATDDQREQFVKVVARYLDERGKLQRKLAEAGGDAAARETELKSLEEDRNARILSIFGAADYAKIEERLSSRGRWRGDGRRPGSPRGR